MMGVQILKKGGFDIAAGGPEQRETRGPVYLVSIIVIAKVIVHFEICGSFSKRESLSVAAFSKNHIVRPRTIEVSTYSISKSLEFIFRILHNYGIEMAQKCMD